MIVVDIPLSMLGIPEQQYHYKHAVMKANFYDSC